jgi:2-polyprenyl-3-methyl-5-hydroxy-6-metoxy-1,4-benzoquinol methylase
MPDSLEHAKRIVLTPDPDNLDYFKDETAYTIKLIEDLNILTDQSIVVDYGCGMGRLSQPIIDKFGCTVVGIEQTDTMLKFANQYVNNTKFTATKENRNYAADLLLSIFVLQHSADPESNIDYFYETLKPNGLVVLVNEHTRYVPVALDQNNYVVWQDDKIDILALMANRFRLVSKNIYYNGNDILTIWKKT